MLFRSGACAAPAASSACPVAERIGDRSARGVHDLAGNVREWTSSAFCRASDVRCDPAAIVVRGGSFRTGDPREATGFHRDGRRPDEVAADVGFRCATTPTRRR